MASSPHHSGHGGSQPSASAISRTWAASSGGTVSIQAWPGVGRPASTKMQPRTPSPIIAPAAASSGPAPLCPIKIAGCPAALSAITWAWRTQ